MVYCRWISDFSAMFNIENLQILNIHNFTTKGANLKVLSVYDCGFYSLSD